jgi:hypothetical protein
VHSRAAKGVSRPLAGRILVLLERCMQLETGDPAVAVMSTVHPGAVRSAVLLRGKPAVVPLRPVSVVHSRETSANPRAAG